jgi:hypothetical protein
MRNTIHNKNLILENLIKNQIANIELDKKFTLSDIKRVANNLPYDIFGDECSIWEGSIIKTNNKEYISFYINNKKYSLHRILYINYINSLEPTEYLKYTCPNKGKCCTLKHFYKVNKETKPKIQKIVEEKVETLPKKSNLVSF